MNRIRIRLDFEKSLGAGAFAGLCFFLLMLTYFGMENLRDVPTGTLIFSGILPMLLCVGFIVLTRCVRLRIPAVYLGFWAVFWVYALVWGCSGVGAVWAVLHVVLMLGALACLVAYLLGVLPGYWAMLAVAAAIACRVLLGDLTRLSAFASVPVLLREGALLSLMAGELAMLKLFRADVSMKTPTPDAVS